MKDNNRNITITEKVKRFLIKKNAYHHFMYCTFKDMDARGIHDHEITDLGSSFSWFESPQGYDYWCKLSAEFLENENV